MHVRSLTVLPATPEKLSPLLELAYNMWFSWNWDATHLFSQLDSELWWQEARGNPIAMLSLVPQERLEELSRDSHYMAALDSVYGRFKKYLGAKTWYEKKFGEVKKPEIAYFCCEYGIHESLPIYSGGLGVLSGDHLKSASDLGIPLVGVGLLYKLGYFQQYLNIEGMQQEAYPENPWYSMPIHLLRDKAGKPLLESVTMGEEQIFFRIWEVKVGRISLYLLDTHVEENPPHHQNITTRLYDSDRDVRIRQEILLGIGGMKALACLGIEPKVYHMNEGHSAFLVLERLRLLMEEKKLSYAEASEAVRATSVFTTHTPVPAGNERFHPDLILRYLGKRAGELGLDIPQFLALGRENPSNHDEEFCMTILALKKSVYSNGVAKLHGKVSRSMWQVLYPQVPTSEVPIGSITNGVHATTWISPQLKNLMLEHNVKVFNGDTDDAEMWEGVTHIPPAALWKTHSERRSILIDMVRTKLRRELKKRGASSGELSQVDSILDPKILTIGFARRFATYKRGSLFLRNPERLLALLKNPDRPVQFLIAGKAHPADQMGKDVIKQICQFAVRYKCQDRLVFVENYDLAVARYLVQGVDVWLNNPRRPLEASGTSGMKAAVNGVLNLSILDGWWDEGYHPDSGWAIGQGEELPDTQYQDEVEGDLLYRTLEHSVVPIFYDRDAKGIPESWVKMMIASIRRHGSQFNTHRMVADYTRHYYHPAVENHGVFDGDGFAQTKSFTKWLEKIKTAWPTMKMISVADHMDDEVRAGQPIQVEVRLELGDVPKDGIRVEIYHGKTNHQNQIEDGKGTPLSLHGEEGKVLVFKGTLPLSHGGRYGYSVRVLPNHPLLLNPFTSGLILWS